jgi:FMN-dependent NADH-azoreductase
VKLLEIQSSPRGESPDSITLTTSFIEACKSNDTSIVVDTLNVWHERLPEFDHEAIGAKYKAVPEPCIHFSKNGRQNSRSYFAHAWHPNGSRPAFALKQ